MLKFVLFIIVLCTWCSSAHASYWNLHTFNFSITEDTTIKIVDEFRYDSGLHTFVQYVGLEKILNENVSIAGWHKLVEKRGERHWIESHRAVGDIILKKKILSSTFTNRSRFEYGLTDTLWLYRNRSKISLFPVFVSNESFFRLHPDNEFYENRFSVGITSKFLFGSKMSVYYMLRIKESDNWKRSNIVGLSLKYSF